jgi:hypothetical protein
LRIVLVEACMKRIYIAITVLTVSAQVFLPTTVSARQTDEAQTTPGQLQGQSSIGAAQGPTAGPRSSAGGRLLRNASIGAAIGAAAVGTLSYAMGGDCGDCSTDTVKATLSGAMYGAFIGAAIRLHPSRRPGHPSRRPTLSPQLTKHVKAMNVVVRF